MLGWRVNIPLDMARSFTIKLRMCYLLYLHDNQQGIGHWISIATRINTIPSLSVL